MKTIKNITVTVKYKVTLSNLEITDEIYNSFIERMDDCDNVDGFEGSDESNWLVDNINEQDACYLEYEIDWIE